MAAVQRFFRVDDVAIEQERVKTMYQKTVKTIGAVHKTMEALDSLDKEYNITKTIKQPVPRIGDKDGIRHPPVIEWTITEVDEQEGTKSYGVGDLTINVNMVSNIEDFSERFTKEFEKVIAGVESMMSRPLSDYVSVGISAGDAEQT